MRLTLLIWAAFAANKLNKQSHFDVNKAKPNPILIKEIMNLCSQIDEQTSVIIEGHTDTRGGDSYNLKLSKKRAEEVKKLILQCPIKPKEIKTIGMGKNFPISKNHDENRRVEIHLIGPKIKKYIIKELPIQEDQEKDDDNDFGAENEFINENQVIIVEKQPIVTPPPYHKWHIGVFTMNGYYNLQVHRYYNGARALLERSWIGGVLIERHINNGMYLGGGLTFDGQVLLNISYGFGQ